MRVKTQAAPTPPSSPAPPTRPCRRRPTARRWSRSSRSGLAAAGQLRALLRPLPPSRVNTHAAPRVVAVGAADQRGVPVGRQRHGSRRSLVAGRVGAGQLRPLLRPRRAGADEHPGRADVACRTARRRARCSRRRTARHGARTSGPDLAASDQLRALLGRCRRAGPRRGARACGPSPSARAPAAAKRGALTAEPCTVCARCDPAAAQAPWPRRDPRDRPRPTPHRATVAVAPGLPTDV